MKTGDEERRKKYTNRAGIKSGHNQNIFIRKYEEQRKNKHKALSHLVSNRFVNDELATTPIPHKLKFVRVFFVFLVLFQLFIGPSLVAVCCIVLLFVTITVHE